MVDLLTTMTSLNCHLRDVLKEQQDTALQIIEKRKELQLKLQEYKELLVAQELDWQKHAIGQERENIE
jgi:metal-sulfur cluster biosynthetic enzyme